jgi:23S rRNA maturation-related 3'-5' exoribonuclease YhaM
MEISYFRGFLQSPDFFTAPASTKYHKNYPGGLADHCLNLLEPLKLSNSCLKKKDQLPEDSLTIITLCHDICKEGLYIGHYGNYRTLEGHSAKINIQFFPLKGLRNT